MTVQTSTYFLKLGLPELIEDGVFGWLEVFEYATIFSFSVELQCKYSN